MIIRTRVTIINERQHLEINTTHISAENVFYYIWPVNKRES